MDPFENMTPEDRQPSPAEPLAEEIRPEQIQEELPSPESVQPQEADQAPEAEQTQKPEPFQETEQTQSGPSPEDTEPAFKKPRSPYENSPYESFYESHAQKPGAHRRKGHRRLPPIVGTMACVAVGCLITGLLVSAKVHRDAAIQERYLSDRINHLEERLSKLDTGDTSTPLPAGGVLTPAQVYAQNVNSVVGITCDSSATVAGQTLKRTASGSGFVLSEDGYIVTNYHVVEKAKKITVTTQNGSSYEAAFIGRDNSADMALIKIEAEGLAPVTLGSSRDLAIGDMVVAIGNPLSTLDATQTVGYISGKNREVSTESGGNVVNMLQTDAAINSGNSGGPLFNMRGEVVGITTAKYSGTTTSGASIEGLSFAIPIDDLKGSMEDLKNQGYVNSAYLGIHGMDVEAAAVNTYGLPKGAYVEDLEPGFAAEAAGVQPKDIIISLGGETITGMNSLARALRNFQAGDKTTLRVYRSGKELDLSITLSQRPAETESAAIPQEGNYEDWFNFFNGIDTP